MPANPRTLLRPLPVPAIQSRVLAGGGGGNPQVQLSGLMQGPLPTLVFDDDIPKLGGPTNCNLRFNQNRVTAPVAAELFTISGVTRDSAGNPLGGCTVKLFTTTDDVERYSTVSDAGGNYSFSVPSNGWTWYAVAYLAGSPDLAGTTVNTLLAA